MPFGDQIRLSAAICIHAISSMVAALCTHVCAEFDCFITRVQSDELDDHRTRAHGAQRCCHGCKAFLCRHRIALYCSYRPLANTGTAIARSDVRILIIVLVKKPCDLLSQGACVEQLAHAPCAIKELPLELSRKCIPLHN